MTILEKVTIELSKLKPDLAKGDVAKSEKEIGITRENIYLYFKGKGSNPETAVRILQHFRKIVDERKKAIA